MNTNEVIRLIRNKDEKALVYLYDNYSGALNGIILRILPSEKLAEEVLQQTFDTIWEQIELYDKRKFQIFTWMCTIARERAMEMKRIKKSDSTSFDPKLHTDQNMHNSLASKVAQPMTPKLDDTHKLILDHILLNGYTPLEVSEKTGIPLETVKTGFRKAILELSTVYKDDKALFLRSLLTPIILTTIQCL